MNADKNGPSTRLTLEFSLPILLAMLAQDVIGELKRLAGA